MHDLGLSQLTFLTKSQDIWCVKSWIKLGSRFSLYIPKQEVIATIKRCGENEHSLGQIFDKVSPGTEVSTGFNNWYNG